MRREIRAYVVDALQMVAPKVHNGRGYSQNAEKLPFIAVYIDREAVERNTVVHRMREAQLHVEYYCDAGAEAVEDVLDEKAEEIETVLLYDPHLGGMASELDITGVESVVLTDDGSDRPLGIIRLNFVVRYRTQHEAV